MNIDVIEKAAFACFSVPLEDNYKRLLFIKIAQIVADNPKISANKCFAELSASLKVDRSVFDSAICALETPFKFLRVDRYKRPAGTGFREIQHLTFGTGESWRVWLEHTQQRHPELFVWITESDVSV